MKKILLRSLALFALLFTLSPRANAHALSLAQANALFLSNGTFTVTMDFDVVALMIGVAPNALKDEQVQALGAEPAAEFTASLDRARQRLLAEIKVLAQDGTEIVPQKIELPTEDKIRAAITECIARKTQPSNFTGSISGEIPSGVKEVRLSFPAVMGAMAVKIGMEGHEPFDALKLPDESSPPYELGEITKGPPMSRAQVLWRYLQLGYTHIIPEGLDHVLFVLGLFLLSTRFKPLLWQVTAFTLAHSITLGLAMYGIFRLPPSIVEPAIALSIAFVAIENICSNKLHAWRPLIVFFFGLIHGLGFAGVLLELGLPRNEFGPALVAFNVGVEGGQLTVIATATLLVGWAFRKPWYRRFITIPASVGIAAMGLFWAWQRIFT